MRIEDVNSLMEFFLAHSTLKVCQENTIMEVFGYFISTDMILEASTMQMIQEITVDTLVEEEEEIPREEMEKTDFDTLTKAELFYTRFEGKEGKDVWTIFDIFETNSIDMTKLDNLIFKRSKDFYTLEILA